MGRLFGFSIGAIALAFGFMNGYGIQQSLSGGSFGSGVKVTHANVSQLLSIEAEKLNKKKGKRRGYSTFDGAWVRGNTLVIDYLVSLNPRRINTVAAANKLRAQLKKKMCKRQHLAMLEKGAEFEISYRTKRKKQFLFEVRFNAYSCREST